MAMSSQPLSSQSGQLTSDDLQEVFLALHSIAPYYVPFGMKLNVPLNTILEKPYANPYDCLLEILDYRLKQLPPLTWHDIVRALQSPLLDQHDLARTIESQYITASQSPASVSQQASAESSHAAIHTSGAQPSTHAPPQPPLHTVAAASVPLTHTPIALPQPPVDGVPAGQRPLTSNDLSHLLNVLNSVASKCYDIGLQLGVKNTQIANIRFNYTKCEDQLREIVVERLKQEPPLTWQDIVTALRADSVRQYGLASEIESTHILALHPPAAVTLQVSTDSMSPATQCVSSHASLQPSLHEVHSDPPQAKRPRLDTSVAQLSEPLPPKDSVTSQHDALYPPEFIKYIKDIYKRSIVGDCKDTKWPPTASEMFIQLAILDRKTVTPQEADAYTEAMVKDGNVDVILQKKTPIEMNDVAKDVEENQIIVVEGAPGVGKSTFAWEFCRRWERGEIAQQYQLVLLLRLRDEGMSTAKTLDDLIYHPSETVCLSVLHDLKAFLGRSALIILEGFDELPKACRSRSSIFLKLISGSILLHATVLITSRHWATRIIHKTSRDRIAQHIEILGFTELQIKNYIQSVFVEKGKDPDEIAKKHIDETVAYIEKYPQIKACMYIPLNSAIVVNIYQESKAGRCIIPETLTGLYYAVTQTLLLRYLYGHPEYGQEDWVVRDIKMDLPKEVFTKLLNICHEAYKGICTVEEDRVQLIFSNLCPGFETLGFMQSVPQLYTTRGAVMSHNFLHLTVQEFLAALHISFMSPEQHLEHLKRHKEGKLKVVLRFLAGLTKLTNISLDQIKGLFGKPLQENESSQGKYCTRMTPDISVAVHHTNWMFETQNTEIIKTLLENGTVEFVCEKGMVPLEYYCVGYCITHSQCNWCLIFAEYIEDEKLEMFLTEINKTGGTEHRVAVKTDQPMSSEKLNTLFAALGSWLEEMYLKLADNGSSLSLTNLPALHILELGMCSKSTFNISSDFPLQSLESLTINAGNGGNTLGLKSCEAIAKFLSSSTSLKELYFNVAEGKKWSMGSKGMEAITKGMSENMALPLRSLEIECKCTFSNTAANFLSIYIGRSTILQDLSLRSITISATCMEAITKGMSDNMALPLRSLEIEYNCTFSDTAANFLSIYIGRSTILQDLSLRSITISATAMEAITKGMSDNMALPLRSLEIECYCTFSDTAANVLSIYIGRSTILQDLSLRSITISATCMEAITKGMSDNMALPLRSLKIECKCTFSNIAAKSLSLFIRNSTALKYIRMCNVAFNGCGLIELTEALLHCSSLQEKKLEKLLLHSIASDDEVTKLNQMFHDHPDMLHCIDWKSNFQTAHDDEKARVYAIAIHHNLIEIEETLDLNKISISDAGAIALAQALHHNSTLDMLDLSHNNISDVGAIALAQALHHNSTLKGLSLSRNNISDAGATALAQALHHNSTLEKLYLSNNNISDAGATGLAQALHHNSTLKGLSLSHNNINDIGATDLAQALHHNSTLERLYLHDNDDIGEEGTRQLVQALTVNTSTNNYVIGSDNMARPLRIQEIKCVFKFSKITADILSIMSIEKSTTLQYPSVRSITINTTYNIMEIISECLSDNMAVPLKSLGIECEGVCTSTAAKSLALFIRNSTALKYITMCNVAFNGCGLIELTEALLHCSSLQEKKLEKLLLHSIESDDEVTKLNQMFHDHPDMLHCIDWKSNFQTAHDDEKARVCAIAIHHNLIEIKGTRKLYLNNISDAGTSLAQALHHNSTLNTLDLSRNNISDAGATALAQALHHNSTLERLDLSSNNISDAGATALAQALHHNSTLKELDLSHNNISDVGATDLAQALRHNSTLRKLELYHNDGIGEEGTRQLVYCEHIHQQNMASQEV